MSEYVLSYYPEFTCLKGGCKHTCCAGWQVPIDRDTLESYKTNSKVAAFVKAGVSFKKSAYKTVKGGKCAFLDECGLCRIHTELGENHTAAVCRDHPRFRTALSDRVETGLGFSCEAAAKIILSYEEKITLVKFGEDCAPGPESPVEKYVLDLRQRALDIIQNRKTPINGRIGQLLHLCYGKIDQVDILKLKKALLRLERLDKGWGKRLRSIKGASPPHVREEFALYCEQFLANSFYRHLALSEDTLSVRTRVVGLILCWHLIESLAIFEGPSLDTFVDVVRSFSCEVEYSTKNLERLFKFFEGLVTLT